ncbi:3-hydroxyacyl-CoA dehydrogenase NAD-binding domain-containing protein [Xenophilus arseniciresistens]|uniref:3-hydroxyacyl-CoA dehydrogenase NAD-binding domain-containing protein n=1 Tax=Xenophilus arseniciresistens TaxID=1283306 RepID=A0AAE3N7U9_9BURK|nr:3-hydroxyacyl-CoA dehydrogenase NAD-binding domain-containing protein [Xenophilus arseniciresistens]MDA7415961.1 3-hydroxyacyl-CoA dehydrogenase NAD-binding domain-containing protein [Xenophilus arseniciresistens]
MNRSPVSLQREGDIGLLLIDNPPVNALSPDTVQGLIDALAAFEAAPELRALVLACEGRTFVAGGDIAAFEDPDFSAVPYNAFLGRLEALTRPVVAAIHGTALGGGLELAMACHWRLALRGTRVGLPEVKLGLIPGSLGTQRLPRLAGAEKALQMMSTGRMVGDQEALAAGILDELCDGDLRAAALARARALVAQDWQPRRASALQVPTAGLAPDFFDQAVALAEAQFHYPALGAIARAVRAAATAPSFAEGEAAEAREFMGVLRTPQSQAMRHLFFAERQTGKIPGLPKDLPLRSIERVGVVGAGTMGGGIAMALANAGLPVVLVEATSVALERGMGLIRKNYEATVAKGKLAADVAEKRIALITPSLSYDDLAQVDLVIEAVFEDMALKKEIAAKLGAVVKPGAIIATNTSTLDVDQIAQASGRPADMLGMHFFSPANVMRLLEVVRGARTDPAVLATVMKLAPRIGKVAVVSGVCYGFIGNRMAEVYMREAEFLLMEGATPAQVDGAVQALGLAMGPCRMLDMAGIDVGAKTVIELGKTGGLPADPSYRALVQALYARGQYGQKTGAGYYRYEGRTPLPNPDTLALAEALAREHGIARREDISDNEIVERLIYSMVNEGARILEEGIAYRGSDIDVVWTAGYGFPDHAGGPMCLADLRGLAHVVQRLEHYAQVRGNAHGYWRVSPLLRQRAAEGRTLSLGAR